MANKELGGQVRWKTLWVLQVRWQTSVLAVNRAYIAITQHLSPHIHRTSPGHHHGHCQDASRMLPSSGRCLDAGSSHPACPRGTRGPLRNGLHRCDFRQILSSWNTSHSLPPGNYNPLRMQLFPSSWNSPTQATAWGMFHPWMNLVRHLWSPSEIGSQVKNNLIIGIRFL